MTFIILAAPGVVSAVLKLQLSRLAGTFLRFKKEFISMKGSMQMEPYISYIPERRGKAHIFVPLILFILGFTAMLTSVARPQVRMPLQLICLVLVEYSLQPDLPFVFMSTLSLYLRMGYMSFALQSCRENTVLSYVKFR